MTSTKSGLFQPANGLGASGGLLGNSVRAWPLDMLRRTSSKTLPKSTSAASKAPSQRRPRPERLGKLGAVLAWGRDASFSITRPFAPFKDPACRVEPFAPPVRLGARRTYHHLFRGFCQPW